MKHTTNRESCYYTVYLKKSDELLASGYANECAEQMNISVHSFYSMVSRVKSGKNNKYEVFTQHNEY